MTEKQLPTQEDMFLDLNKESYKSKTVFFDKNKTKITDGGFTTVSEIPPRTNTDKLIPKKPDTEQGKTVQLNENKK